jgi:hypothetical protein
MRGAGKRKRRLSQRLLLIANHKLAEVFELHHRGMRHGDAHGLLRQVLLSNLIETLRSNLHS